MINILARLYGIPKSYHCYLALSSLFPFFLCDVIEVDNMSKISDFAFRLQMKQCTDFLRMAEYCFDMCLVQDKLNRVYSISIVESHRSDSSESAT